MMKLILALICGLLLTLLAGCVSSRYVAVHHDFLQSTQDHGQLVQFAALNGDEYRMTISDMDSAYLRGEGQWRAYEKGDWRAFSGTVPLDSVGLVLVTSNTAGGTILALSCGGALLTYLLMAQESEDIEDDALRMDIYYPPGDNSSCPFVYSSNGDGEYLEAEAIGTALGKGLEMTTSHNLPHLQPVDGRATIRIANERPETHYIDHVALMEMQLPAGRLPVFDTENRVWPIGQLTAPISADDAYRGSVRQELSANDRHYWQYDLAAMDAAPGFRSEIELSYVRPAGIRSGLLIVDAINTEISSVLFQQLFAFVDDEALRFYNLIDGDAAWIAILEHWRWESALCVEVMTTGGWREMGRILPEANAVPFRRALQFDIPDSAADTVRVRVSSLADVWRLDALSMSWDAMAPLDSAAITRTPAPEEHNPLLARIDEQYETLLPGQSLTLEYAIPDSSAAHRFYALELRGYLHEWILPSAAPTTFATLAGQLDGATRLQLLQHLLSDTSPLFLAPAYATWRQIKALR